MYRRKNRLALLMDGLVVGTFLVLAFGPVLLAVGDRMDLSSMLSLPSSEHWLGTDSMGRDLFARYGKVIRETVLIVWVWVTVASLAGFLLGSAVCAIPGSKRGQIVSSLTDGLLTVISSVPIAIAVFLLAATFADQVGLPQMLICLTILFMAHSMKAVRLLFQRDQGLGFWESHHSIGGSRWSRIWQYGLNDAWRGELMQTLIFHLKIAIVIEASLSYLKMGVQEPQPSFGNILSAHFEHSLRGGNGWIILATAAILYLCLLVLDRISTQKARSN